MQTLQFVKIMTMQKHSTARARFDLSCYEAVQSLALFVHVVKINDI